jgi:hypothetical protein
MQSEAILESQISGGSIDVLEPLENGEIRTASMAYTGEHNGEPGGYISQRHLIEETMRASFPSEDLYIPAMNRFQDLIRSQYADSNYTEDWRQWRAESLLWDYYCR